VESEHPYLYARGNVVNLTDASGLCVPDDPICWAVYERILTLCPECADLGLHNKDTEALTRILNDIIPPSLLTPTSSSSLSLPLPIGFVEVVQAVIDAHNTYSKDDGFIIGVAGGIGSLMNAPALTFLVPPHFVEFNGCRLPQSGLAAGFEVVYDFKHLEKGYFLYNGTTFMVGSAVNAGGIAYVGKTRGFDNYPHITYEEGVYAYRGYFASGAVNATIPAFEVGFTVIEAAPLDQDEKLNPNGVFATYYGFSGGLGASLPINGEIAVTNYSGLMREKYLFLGDEDEKKNDIGYRQTVANFMALELQLWAANPLTDDFVPEALANLRSFVNDTSD
jgi:hypothetical protein